MVQVLPASVRLALQCQGTLGKQEIKDMLLTEASLLDEVVYLLFSAFDKIPTLQQRFANELISLAIQREEAIPEYLAHIAGSLPPDQRVPAHRLVEMSWCGFGFRELYHRCATECWVNYLEPMLLGYTGAVGLVPFIKYRKPFTLVIPDRLNTGDYCGYYFDMAVSNPSARMFALHQLMEKPIVVYFPGKGDQWELTKIYLERYSHYVHNPLLADVPFKSILGEGEKVHPEALGLLRRVHNAIWRILPPWLPSAA